MRLLFAHLSSTLTLLGYYSQSFTYSSDHLLRKTFYPDDIHSVPFSLAKQFTCSPSTSRPTPNQPLGSSEHSDCTRKCPDACSPMNAPLSLSRAILNARSHTGCLPLLHRGHTELCRFTESCKNVVSGSLRAAHSSDSAATAPQWQPDLDTLAACHTTDNHTITLSSPKEDCQELQESK